MNRPGSEQPRLDHASTAFARAKEAERALLETYGLRSRDAWIELSDPRIRVRVSVIGEGRRVVVTPGNTGDMFPLIPLLAELPGLELNVINRPGGGLSDGLDHTQIDPARFIPDMFERVFDGLGIDSAPILAHSMGCHWTALFAKARPERVEKLVFIGNPGRMLPDGASVVMRVLTSRGIGDRLVRAILPKRPDRSFHAQRLMGSDMKEIAKLPQSLAEAYFHFQNLPHYARSLVTLLHVFNTADDRAHGTAILPEDLAAIPAETLLVWGERDTFGNLDKARAIARHLPRGTLRIVPGAGHMPWLDRGSEVAAHVRGFLG